MAKKCKKKKHEYKINRVSVLKSGDGGIRTLVPRRANAFRVRPVMTTSIRLQICFCKYLISISYFA